MLWKGRYRCAVTLSVDFDAETLWSGSGFGYDDFAVRLTEHLARLDAAGVEYHRPSGPLPWQTRPGVTGRPSTREERAAYMAQIVANIGE